MGRLAHESMLRRALEQRHFTKDGRPPKAVLDAIFANAMEACGEAWERDAIETLATTQYEFLVSLLKMEYTG